MARRRVHPLRAIALLPLAGAVMSCHWDEPFARNSPWDSGSKAVVTLTGPDSSFSLGETITLTLTTDPPLPPPPYLITWLAPGETNPVAWVFPAGDAQFLVSKADANYQEIELGVQFDARQVFFKILVGQKVATLQLKCSNTACDATPLGVGGNRVVTAIMKDANTNDLGRKDVAMGRGSVVSRDPSVLSVFSSTPNTGGTYTVRGVATGNTWLVVTIDGKKDSAHFVVP